MIRPISRQALRAPEPEPEPHAGSPSHVLDGRRVRPCLLDSRQSNECRVENGNAGHASVADSEGPSRQEYPPGSLSAAGESMNHSQRSLPHVLATPLALYFRRSIVIAVEGL